MGNVDSGGQLEGRRVSYKVNRPAILVATLDTSKLGRDCSHAVAAGECIIGLAQSTQVHSSVHNAQPSVTLTAHLRLSKILETDILASIFSSAVSISIHEWT
jgi:hypothetical protein